MKTHTGFHPGGRDFQFHALPIRPDEGDIQIPTSRNGSPKRTLLVHLPRSFLEQLETRVGKVGEGQTVVILYFTFLPAQGRW